MAAAFLARSQTKDVSASSLVQDSGAPAWLSTAGARFPTLAADYPAPNTMIAPAKGLRRWRMKPHDARWSVIIVGLAAITGISFGKCL